jgi:hypothetical protein
MPRLIAPLLLVFALLFFQQGSALHALSHLADTSQQHDQETHPNACEQCAVYAQLGNAPTSSVQNEIIKNVIVSTQVTHVTILPSHPLPKAAARGPPGFLLALT